MRSVTLVTVLMILLSLAACQPGEKESGPRLITGWQPTPLAERPAPSEPSLPETEPPGRRPEIALPEASEPNLLGIPEMEPTPIPPNVYVEEATGFTVPFPSSWELEELDGGGVSLFDPTFGIFLLIFPEAGDVDSFDAYLDDFIEDEFDFFGDLSLISDGELPFAGDKTAGTALLQEQVNGETVRNIWLAYAEAGVNTYVFTALGEPEKLEARQTTLATILSQAKPGGVSTFGLDRAETLVILGGDPLAKDLDPARQTGSAAGPIGMLYSGLVRLTPELGLELDLAESWSVSPDGAVYTFVLREDAAFQSGDPITAADVRFSWERATDPETDSTTAATYLGDIKGVSEKMSGEAETIAGLKVIDDRTLEVTLTGPIPYFLLKLTYPTSFVVDEGSVDPDDEEWVFEPNASGPYVLKEFREDTAIIFERNEAYHSPPPIRYVIQLIYRIGSRVSLFESGEIDYVYPSANEVKRIREPGDELHDRWSSTTSLCTIYVQMDNTLAPMDDPDVRLAFSLAVDKEGMNELFSEGLNLVATTILPPAMPGYSAEEALQRAGAAYDPEAARAALAASAYADSLPPITITAGGFGDSGRPDIDFLISGWQDVLGADVTVELLDPQDFARAARGNHGHMVSYGWCADYPDPGNFLDILFHSGSDFNISKYTNPEIDGLLEEARFELDPAQRLDLYQQIEAMLLDDSAVIPLNHGVTDILVSERVQGFVLAPMGAPIIHRLSLAPVEEGDQS